MRRFFGAAGNAYAVHRRGADGRSAAARRFASLVHEYRDWRSRVVRSRGFGACASLSGVLGRVASTFAGRRGYGALAESFGMDGGYGRIFFWSAAGRPAGDIRGSGQLGGEPLSGGCGALG